MLMKKIRVAFVNHSLVCGGAEKALFDLIRLLDKERFEVCLFVQEPGHEWEKKFWDTGIPVVYDYTCRKATWNPVQKLGNLVKKRRIARAYQADGEGLLEVCLPFQPDVVVSYNVWIHERMVFARGAKTVKYIHGDPGTNPDYRQEAVEHREMLSRFDRIVCVSQPAMEAFQALSGIRDTVELHYNPMDSEAVLRLSRELVDLPEDAPLVCAVGRLSAEKGFERLIVIHKRLLEQGIFHRLVIVGDGPDRDFLRRLVNATETQDTVILAGYQENPYPYMQHSRFLVNASFTEGLPVIAMEAMSLGVPIVAPVPSVAEAFGEEPCGLITANDNASLEAGIRTMLTDEGVYAQAKAAAQRRSAFFDGHRMVREIEQMFQSLADQP